MKLLVVVSEDGYNVEAKYSRAAVQVYPRPVVSIEPEGGSGNW